MFDYLRVLPAYGRRYESKAEVLADWEDGKDFRVVGGPYMSKRDMGGLAANFYVGVSINWSYFHDPIYIDAE